MFCDLYACIKLFISNNLRIYDVRRYYRFESRTHRFSKEATKKALIHNRIEAFSLVRLT